MAAQMISVSVVGTGKPVMDEAFADLARSVGRIVAEHGCNLITGGGRGVMELVAEGFCRTPDRVGRSIGILPGKMNPEEPTFDEKCRISIEPNTHYPNAFIEVPIYTHLPGKNPKAPTSRNYLNARTGAIMIALHGDNGTQAEVEIALALGKPVIALLGEGQRIGIHLRSRLPKGVIAVGGLEELSDALGTKLRTEETVARLARPAFDAIHAVYSTDPASVHTCSMHFPDTCAIRMSEALVKTVSGIKDKFDASGLNLCPHGYMRGAEDLAAVLRRADVFGMYDAGFSKPGAPPAGIKGKKGIVAYINIPDFSGQGHIDLWDGASPVGSAYWNADPIWFWKLG